MQYYGSIDAPGVHLPFNFQLLDAEWDAAALAALIAEYETALPPGGWPNWVMGSHDSPRIAGRIGEAQARVAAMLLLTLRGTPTLYQGDELGIGLVAIPQDRVRDPQDLRQPGLGLGRDGSRTPMAWDSSPQAGFSAAEPWLPLHGDWQTRNVSLQAQDPASMLSLYRCLLALRRSHRALSLGAKSAVTGEEGVLRYERYDEKERLLVALNLTTEPRRLALPAKARMHRCLLSTITDRCFDGTLAPDEGVILQLEER
jgi:oligo-1,6-glucosidase/alpha-glucosidase